MNRQECINLLEIIAAPYPNAHIKDAKRLVDAWMLALGDYSAEAVYKAARLHLSTCQFFPTPSDIQKCMLRAQLVYHNDTEALNGSNTKPIGEYRTMTDDELEQFCQFVGLGYPDEI